MAVDMVRRSYSTMVKPFRNSDRQVEIIWYPCADDAPDLPFPSAINSLDWVADAEKSRPLDVGEVFGAERKYAGKKALPYAVIDHLCGSREDFEKGAIYDPLAPDIPFDFEKFPLCCLPQHLGQGGMEWSGVGTVSAGYQAGLSCGTAQHITSTVPFGTNFGDYPPFTNFWWFVDGTIGSTLYTLIENTSGLSGNIFQGPCSGLTVPALSFPAPFKIYITKNPAKDLIIEFHDGSGGVMPQFPFTVLPGHV